MKRISTSWRQGWQQKVESVGFPFHSKGIRPDPGHGTYWKEDAYYEFTAPEIDHIELATNALHEISMRAVDRVVRDPSLMKKLAIPEFMHDYVKQSWLQAEPTIYGRFDLSYDPEYGTIKMLEYNADTPTTLIESAIVQWYWLKDKFGDSMDQFNSIHERLINAWSGIAQIVGKEVVYFAACPESLEEFATVEYLRDTAHQAGVLSEFIDVNYIGWNVANFTDIEENPIKYIFKLYPWEWMAAEEFGRHIPRTQRTTGFLEPAWKMVLSNKGILPILWEMFPGHPNLLESHWIGNLDHDIEAGTGEWIQKPILSREGHNISWYKDGIVERFTDGNYAAEPRIWQKAAKLGRVDGNYFILGSWVIAGESAGMLVREDTSPIIVDTSPCVPHCFK